MAYSLTSTTAQQALSQLGSYTPNPDGSVTFTSGKLAGRTGTPKMGPGFVPVLDLGGNQYTTLVGSQAGNLQQGQSFGGQLLSALPKLAAVVGAGVGLAAATAGSAGVAADEADGPGSVTTTLPVNGQGAPVTTDNTTGAPIQPSGSLAPGAINPWTAALGTLGSVGSALIQSNAAGNAVSAETQAGQQALADIQQQNQTAQSAISGAQGTLATAGQNQAALYGSNIANLNSIGQADAGIYNSQVNNLAPYASFGASALGPLAAGLGLLPSSSPASSVSAPRLSAASFAAPQTSTAATQTTPQASGGSVLMVAPDGSQQAVPASQVAHYQSLGASVAGGR